jgi:hypothetical protein
MKHRADTAVFEEFGIASPVHHGGLCNEFASAETANSRADQAGALDSALCPLFFTAPS